MSEHDFTHSLLPLHYEGHQVRAHVDAMGMVWWVAQDVGTILGLREVRSNLRKWPEDEKGVHSMHTPGGPHSLLTVNEPGLYRLIFQSRKPEAEALKRWVFHDVLPMLRRTGTYTIPGQAGSVPGKAVTTPAPSHHLPPPPRYPMQEKPHVSEHLIAVWTTLRQADAPMTNAEIMTANRMKEGVTRKWTRYLVHIGLVDLLETAPAHLFMVAEQADKRHAGYYQRLERIAQIMDQRQRRLFA